MSLSSLSGDRHQQPRSRPAALNNSAGGREAPVMEPEKKGKEFEFEKKRWRHQLFSNLLLISTIILYSVVLLGNPGASAEGHSLYVMVRN
jgi:hypothetical protein